MPELATQKKERGLSGDHPDVRLDEGGVQFWKIALSSTLSHQVSSGNQGPVFMIKSAQFRASPDEVRGRLSKLTRRFN